MPEVVWATSVLSRVVVFDERMYAPGHTVHKWVAGVTRRFTLEAIRAAPVRTGRLAGSISGDTDRTGERSVDGVISASAPYVGFVLTGTSSPIMARAAWMAGGSLEAAYMEGVITDPVTGATKIGKVGRPGFWMHLKPAGPIRHAVAGQAANNFLFTAWRRTAADHRAIRGKLPETVSNPSPTYTPGRWA